MKQSDRHLVLRLRDLLDSYIEDQQRTKPLHKAQDLPFEVQGHLADMLYTDSHDNELMLSLLLGFVEVAKSKKGDGILQTLKDVRSALNNIRVEE